MTWPRWNWLDRGLLPLLLALLRLCWLWPWLALLRQLLAPSFAGPLLAPGALLIVPLLSFAFSHAAPLQQLPAEKPVAVPKTTMPWWARTAIALLGLVTILVALWWQLFRADYALWDVRWLGPLGLALIHWPADEVPAAWLMIVALIYLWLRGMLDAAQPMSHDDLWGAIVAGVVALVGYLLLINALSFAPVANLGNLVVLFFAAGMMALAFSSLKITVGLDYALGFGPRQAVKAPQASRYWLVSVLIVVGMLLGLGVGVALLVAPEQVAQFMAVVNRSLGLVWQLISLVLLGISYVLFMIVYIIVRLLQPLIERLLALLQAAQIFQQMQQPLATPTPALTPPPAEAMPDAYRWLALAIFVIAVLTIFALVLRKLRAAQLEAVDEVRESILSADLLQDQLARLWQRLFGRAGALLPGFLALDGEATTRQQIRRAYQGLLAAASALGAGRQPGQTPVEYRGQLAQKMVDSNSPLTTMTRLYNNARYAPEPPEPADAEAAQQAWQALQQRLAQQVETEEQTEANKERRHT